MSAFSPEAFLDATITEPTVKRPPLPVEFDYTAVIGQITSREWTGKADPTKSGIALDIPLTLEIPAEVQASLGLSMSTIQMKDSIMLDLTPNGMIDNSPGKNRRLRVYREALDMNKPGDVFSPRKMEGQAVKVKIVHKMWEGEIVENVGGVTAA